MVSDTPEQRPAPRRRAGPAVGSDAVPTRTDNTAASGDRTGADNALQTETLRCAAGNGVPSAGTTDRPNLEAPQGRIRTSAPDAPDAALRSATSPTENPAPLARSAPLAVRVVLVTGPSGAGRSTAINALEDLGFEAIDNMPLGLLPRLFEGPPPEGPMALGIDARNRDFSAAGLIAAHARLAAMPGYAPDLLYLDCATDVLQRRYSETRRRHPLAPEADPAQGIAREVALLAPVRVAATVLVDTSGLTPHDLRAEITRLFAPERAGRLAITVTSFSYRRGLPTGADLVFDCRFLRNPHWDSTLRQEDGRARTVQAYVAADPRFTAFRDQVIAMADLLLPAFEAEGKSHLTIAFGCTGGQHRSVAMTEILSAHLAEAGWPVSKRHREVEQRRAAGTSAEPKGPEATGT